ncbi:hypothetical protein LTR95_012019 [Oleoguttula sp. CCFEE 5521]
MAPMSPTANRPMMSIPSRAAPPVADPAVLEALGAAPVALGPAKPLVGPTAVEESVADAAPPVADALVASVLDTLLPDAEVVSIPDDDAELALPVALPVAEASDAVEEAVDDALEESEAEDEVEITNIAISTLHAPGVSRDAHTDSRDCIWAGAD